MLPTPLGAFLTGLHGDFRQNFFATNCQMLPAHVSEALHEYPILRCQEVFTTSHLCFLLAFSIYLFLLLFSYLHHPPMVCSCWWSGCINKGLNTFDVFRFVSGMGDTLHDNPPQNPVSSARFTNITSFYLVFVFYAKNT